MANVVCSSYPRVRETATAEVIIDIRLYDDLASSVALWYCRGKIKNRFCFSFIFKNPRLKLWAQTDTVSWIAQSAKKKDLIGEYFLRIERDATHVEKNQLQHVNCVTN